MKFEKLFEAVTVAKTAREAAKKAPALLELNRAADKFDFALNAVKDAEDMTKALEAVTVAKTALVEAENSKAVIEAIKAVKDAEEAVKDAEASLREGLEGASQYDVTLYLVTVEGHSLNNALSNAYMELRGNGSIRGHQQFVQKLKEGIRFALDCMEYGLTVNDLDSML